LSKVVDTFLTLTSTPTSSPKRAIDLAQACQGPVFGLEVEVGVDLKTNNGQPSR